MARTGKNRWPTVRLGRRIPEDGGKGKVHRCPGTEALYRPYGYRGSRGIALFLHDQRGWGVSVTPRPLFTPWERPGNHCTGGWVGPKAGLDKCGKSRPPPGFDPRTVQPVASRYTDWATRPTRTVVVSGIYIRCVSYTYFHQLSIQ